MGEEVELLTKSEDLLNWLGENDLLMELNAKEADVLLGYMEGHGYSLGVQEDKLVRVDIGEENGEVMEYSIDDAIDTACEWNYELIQEVNDAREHPDHFLDFCRKQSRYESLREDEKLLDKMFDRTCYGREINNLATKLANAAIEQMKASQDVEQAAMAVTEGIGSYHTNKEKGRSR